jgi:hypothetical protein
MRPQNLANSRPANEGGIRLNHARKDTGGGY